MNLSLGVVWAAILLAPGLVIFGALFGAPYRPPLRPVAPAPASLTALAIIVGGAAVAHSVWLTLSSLNALACASGCPVTLGFDPNVYTLALGIGREGQPVVAGALAYAVLNVVTLTGISYLVARAVVGRPAVRERLRPLRYGWLAHLSREFDARPGGTIAAFALTKLQEGGLWVGYEGEVETIQLDGDRAIASIVLLDARSFVVELKRDGFTRTASRGRASIQRLTLRRDAIENIALVAINRPG